MNILTFDIEEWFHILDNDSTKNETNWNKYESRIHKNMDIIFEILQNNNVSATFFVLGWIAKKYPEIVKRISKNGFEIGSHTHMHQLIYNQTRLEFFNDVERSIKSLEDITGKKIKSFRAPGFSIMDKNKWAFEVLFDLGIRKDCSVFPAPRSHGGLPNCKFNKPFILNYEGVTLKEFPINTKKILNLPFIFSGGGYFRLFPYQIIKNLSKNSDYVMTYFHPRDFDSTQPIIKELTAYRKFKSYVGLKNCKNKLEKWLKHEKFIDLSEADELIDWKSVPNVNI